MTDHRGPINPVIAERQRLFDDFAAALRTPGTTAVSVPRFRKAFGLGDLGEDPSQDFIQAILKVMAAAVHATGSVALSVRFLTSSPVANFDGRTLWAVTKDGEGDKAVSHLATIAEAFRR